MRFDLNTILGNYVPYGVGIIGILVFLAGVFKLIGNKEGAMGNMFTGAVIVVIAIGLRYVLNQFVLPGIS